MQESIRQGHPLRRFFAGLIEDSLYSRVGLCEPNVVEYLAELLVEFVHTDHVYRLRDSAGQPLEQITEMISNAVSPPGTPDSEHRRTVHRHIGDFALFWSGLYPECLGKMRRRNAADGLLDYRTTGKRSYHIASELSSDGSRPPARVLRCLSEEFESCAYGLTLVREGWQKKDPDGFAQRGMIWG